MYSQLWISIFTKILWVVKYAINYVPIWWHIQGVYVYICQKHYRLLSRLNYGPISEWVSVFTLTLLVIMYTTNYGPFREWASVFTKRLWVNYGPLCEWVSDSILYKLKATSLLVVHSWVVFLYSYSFCMGTKLWEFKVLY